MTLALHDHLQTGVTGLCHLWTVARPDGVVLGFTDHDCDLAVEGVIHRAGSGLTASAFQQATGLAVDNSEAVGALSAAAITAEDLDAGRYDGAEVRIWLAIWAQPSERRELFRGSLGEVSRRGAAFRAELRGLAEPLGQPGALLMREVVRPCWGMSAASSACRPRAISATSGCSRSARSGESSSLMPCRALIRAGLNMAGWKCSAVRQLVSAR